MLIVNENISFLPYERKNVSAEYLPESIYNKYNPNYSKNESVIIYSSGTTGKSKGIILSHFAINTNADAIIDYMNSTESDCIYIAIYLILRRLQVHCLLLLKLTQNL